MKKVLGAAVLAVVLGATSLQAAITSKEALNIAEKNFPGSSVKQEIKIDANSGQIVKVENKNKKHILPIEAVDFSKFALSIDEAVAKAQALEAGWSFDEAELDNKNGAWIYKVELKRDKSEKKVIINAQTGEIIGNYTK